MTLTREVWIAFDSFTASGYRTAIFLPPSISLASIFPIGATHLSNRCHPPFQSVPPTNWWKSTTIRGHFDLEQIAGKAALFSESGRTLGAQPCDVSIFPIGATHRLAEIHHYRGEFRRRADGGESSTVQRVGKDALGSALRCEHFSNRCHPPFQSVPPTFPIGATHLSNRCHPPIGGNSPLSGGISAASRWRGKQHCSASRQGRIGLSLAM